MNDLDDAIAAAAGQEDDVLDIFLEQWRQTNALLAKIARGIDDLERTMRPSARRL